MKTLSAFFFLLSFCASQSFSQSFAPFNPNFRYHYQQEGTDFPTNVVFADSVSVFGVDSIFHLNRVVVECDTCADAPDYPPYLLNQPQVYGHTVICQADGRYRFEGKDTFWLEPAAVPGETWVFTPDGSAEASVVDVTAIAVFGFSDQVKTISTTDGYSFRLSESFGLIEYQTPASSFTLTGIEGPDLGERLPGYFDFYDFAAGDVYQYIGSYPLTPGEPTQVLYTEKITILDRIMLPDTIIYPIRRVYRSERMGSTPPFPSSYVQEDTLVFGYDPNAVPALYPGAMTYEPLRIPPVNSFGEQEWGRVTAARDPENGRITKVAGGFFPPSEAQNYPLFQISTGQPDLGVRCCAELFFARYQEGLGLVEVALSYFEVYEGYLLEGYVKQGDTTGIVTPDSLLLVSTDAPQSVTPQITLYPNPARKTLYIEIAGGKNEGEMRLLDVRGNLMLRKRISFSRPTQTIDLTDVPGGVYWLQVWQGGALASKRFIRQ